MEVVKEFTHINTEAIKLGNTTEKLNIK